MKYAYYCSRCDSICIYPTWLTYHKYYHVCYDGFISQLSLVGHEAYPAAMEDWQIKADVRNHIENFGVGQWKILET